MARKIKANLLIKDFSLYPRAQIDPYHVRAMVEALKAGELFPRILVDAKSMRVIDGFHRLSAIQRHLGLDALVECTVMDFVSETEMFEAAMHLNSAHGRSLDNYDKARCLQLGQEFGIAKEKLADALRITTQTIEKMLLTRFTANGQVLKRTLAHLAGNTATDAQMSYNRKAGGLDQLFYINQVIALLESDSLDWGKEQVKSRIERLRQAIEGYLAKV